MKQPSEKYPGDPVDNAQRLKPWQLPWQKQPWQFMCACLAKHNLAHAFVLEGGEGHGAIDFVTAFTQQLHCKNLTINRAENLRNPQPSPQKVSQNANTFLPDESIPCQSCVNCHQIAANLFPDYTILRLAEGKQQIGIEQIRTLTTFFQHSAHSQGYRVMLIKDAELMTHSAMNALLKTLEEPGQLSLLFLQTNHPLSLTATIRSRCQSLSLTHLHTKEVIEWLEQFNTHHLSPEQLQQLLSISNNQPLIVRSFMQTDALQLRSDLMQQFSACLSGKHSVNHFLEGTKNIDIDQLWSWLGQEIMQTDATRGLPPKLALILTPYYLSVQKQLFSSNHVDKRHLLREFLIKSIANSAIMSHS